MHHDGSSSAGTLLSCGPGNPGCSSDLLCQIACGTGACATMVAANLNGLVDDEADLVLLGGTLHIKWDKNENKVYMTGPAKFVFDGTITL